jgi:hypothetical protein
VRRIHFGEGRPNGVALARMLRHNIRRGIRSEIRRHVGESEFIPHLSDPKALVDAVARALAAAPTVTSRPGRP